MIVNNPLLDNAHDRRAQHMVRTFERKNRVRCAGSKGTRPETANGCAFALTIPDIAARYAAWLSYSGSELRLLGLLGV